MYLSSLRASDLIRLRCHCDLRMKINKHFFFSLENGSVAIRHWERRELDQRHSQTEQKWPRDETNKAEQKKPIPPRRDLAMKKHNRTEEITWKLTQTEIYIERAAECDNVCYKKEEVQQDIIKEGCWVKKKKKPAKTPRYLFTIEFNFCLRVSTVEHLPFFVTGGPQRLHIVLLTPIVTVTVTTAKAVKELIRRFMAVFSIRLSPPTNATRG